MAAPWQRDSDLSPGATLEAAFRRIEREHMAGLPLLNPALRVAVLPAIGWQGRWLTVLITPWCMNVVLLPAEPGRWTAGHGHERIFYKLPAGDLAFLCGCEAETGAYHSCALFSQMGSFVDQQAALDTAAAALRALLQPPPCAACDTDSDSDATAAADADDATRAEQGKLRSRRAFLSGSLIR